MDPLPLPTSVVCTSDDVFNEIESTLKDAGVVDESEVITDIELSVTAQEPVEVTSVTTTTTR
jgi:hypothetical protein